jgi:hypothetical protein
MHNELHNLQPEVHKMFFRVVKSMGTEMGGTRDMHGEITNAYEILANAIPVTGREGP